MKILHVFDLFSPYGGGTTAIIQKISRALTQKGHEVTIFTSDSGLDRKYIESLAGIEVHPFHCISRAANFFFTPSMINDVKRHLKDFHVIHLHCYRSFQNIVIHHYAARYGVPYVLDAHGSMQRRSYDGTNYKQALKWFFDMAFGNRILRDASRAIAENRANVRVFTYRGLADLFEYYGFSVEKVVGSGYFMLPSTVSRFFSFIDPRHSNRLIIKARKPLK